MDGQISGAALRARIRRLGITFTEAAVRLGLTRDGLNKQMNEDSPVSRQTELLLGFLEQAQAELRRALVASPEPSVDPGHRTLALRGTPVRRRR